MASTHDRTQALFDKLQRISRRSSNLKPETVHQLRTSIRRIETIVCTSPAKASAKERKLLKQLDRLRRRAGRVRDFDVQIQALNSLRLESVARDRARVLRVLEKGRAKREKKLLKAFSDEAQDGLRKRLKRACTRFRQDSLNRARDHKGEERMLTAALDKFAAAVKQRPTLTEDNLHDFRMDCKRVRYLAEMAGEGPRLTGIIEQLRRIQDSVGTWHDWMTLTATAEKVLFHSGQVPLLSALRTATRSKYLEALRVTTEAKQALLEIRGPSTPAVESREHRRPASEHKLGKPPAGIAPTSARAAVA